MSRSAGSRRRAALAWGPGSGLAWVPEGKTTDALVVRVTATDGAGNAAEGVSDAARVHERPAIERVTARAKGDVVTVKIRGRALAAGATVRVNGAAVGVPVSYSASTGVLKARGTAGDLGLAPAGQTNTVVVVVEGLESAPATFVTTP